MANIALAFGLCLVILGVVGYTLTGSESPTALIPAVFGIVIGATGLMGRDPAKRKMAMHIAVVIALLGFLGAARGLTKIGAVMAGEPVDRPAAVISQSLMALLCLVFTALCVRSFISARRSRTI